MGLLGIFSNPKMLKVALMASGVEAARLDHDTVRGELVLSVLEAGVTKRIQIPIGTTFTLDQLATWLAGQDPLQASAQDPEQAGDRDRDRGDRPETPPNP